MIAFAVFWISIAAVILFLLATIFQLLTAALDTILEYISVILVIGGLLLFALVILYWLFGFGHQVLTVGFNTAWTDFLTFFVIVAAFLGVVLYLGSFLLGIAVAVAATLLALLIGAVNGLAVLFTKGYYGCINALIVCLTKE